MSFTSVIKKELTQLQTDRCCQKAELSALIRINGTIHLNEKQMVLDFSTENPATARHLFLLIKNLYEVQPEVLVRKKIRLKKNNVYLVRVPRHAREILTDLFILKPDRWERVEGIASRLISRECCKRAYLRGAFLAGGSVNNPDSSSYHLEIVTAYYDHSEALCNLMNHFYLHAKMIERKKGFVVYIKEGDKIGEFLNIIGAHPSLLHFENVRIMKDMRNSVNRIVNCETANLNKTIQAAMRQIENIKLIDRIIGLDQLPIKLREVAEIRLKYPDVSLGELGQLLPSGKISKSAINHRLRKIEELAKQLQHTEVKSE
jgi:DNA-binding protein WhiA